MSIDLGSMFAAVKTAVAKVGEAYVEAARAGCVRVELTMDATNGVTVRLETTLRLKPETVANLGAVSLEEIAPKPCLKKAV